METNVPENKFQTKNHATNENMNALRVNSGKVNLDVWTWPNERYRKFPKYSDTQKICRNHS